MIIQPGTTIKILKDVPLDTSYEHTIYFTSEASQNTWFASKSKYNLDANSYQRVNKNTLRIGVVADNLYDCNYMMFQNTNFGTKWFYAYITSVEYVNNQCTEISYEIDVMQTWFFDYTVDYSFVERCHTPTDLIGEHIEPESLDIGELVYNDYARFTELDNLVVIIAIIDLEAGISGAIYDRTYGAATLWAFPATDSSGINSKIEEYLDSPESIINMYMCPAGLIEQTVSSGGTAISQVYAGQIVKSVTMPSSTTTLDGYTPHNCKLYTYPYNFLNVQNGAGSAMALRYEFFDSNLPQIVVYGTISSPVSCVLAPLNYKGSSHMGGSGVINMGETIQLNSFPLCSWGVDTYKAWVAQNSLPIAFNAVADIGKAGVIGAAYGGPGGAVAGAGGTALNVALSALNQGYQASIAADVAKGNFNNGGPNCAMGVQNFFYGRMSLNKYTAKMIDGFFDTFGYGVKTLQKPMRNARPEWTYLKTAGCNLSGSVPADDMKKLVSIYDNGCTWWINGDHVGNYGLPNLATTRG